MKKIAATSPFPYHRMKLNLYYLSGLLWIYAAFLHGHATHTVFSLSVPETPTVTHSLRYTDDIDVVNSLKAGTVALLWYLGCVAAVHSAGGTPDDGVAFLTLNVCWLLGTAACGLVFFDDVHFDVYTVVDVWLSILLAVSFYFLTIFAATSAFAYIVLAVRSRSEEAAASRDRPSAPLVSETHLS